MSKDPYVEDDVQEVLADAAAASAATLQEPLDWSDEVKAAAYNLFEAVMDATTRDGIPASKAQERLKKKGLWPGGPRAGVIVRKFAWKHSREDGDWYVSKRFPDPNKAKEDAVLDEPVLSAEEVAEVTFGEGPGGPTEFLPPEDVPDTPLTSPEFAYLTGRIDSLTLDLGNRILEMQARVEVLERRLDFVGGQVEEILFTGDPDLYWITQLLSEHGDRVTSFNLSRGTNGVTVTMTLKG